MAHVSFKGLVGNVEGFCKQAPLGSEHIAGTEIELHSVFYKDVLIFTGADFTQVLTIEIERCPGRKFFSFKSQ